MQANHQNLNPKVLCGTVLDSFAVSKRDTFYVAQGLGHCANCWGGVLV